DPALAPPVDVAGDPTRIGRLMFSHREATLPATPAPGVGDPAASAALRAIARKSRSGRGEDGAELPALRAITLRDALSEAILHHMIHDDRLVAWGEECREWGGAFGVYRGFSDILPHHRLFNAPISEAAIVAAAVGHAMEGGRSLVELMYADFIGRAGDEILNQMAKWQAMSAGALSLPVVLRASVGSKYGAQHSQDWTGLIAHVPGLKVIYPATPYDAKGLMAAALASEDPVVVFESQRLYDRVETHRPEGVPAAYYRLPLGVPEVRRAGRDLTILTIGPSLYPALAAAAELAAAGIEAEVIDARSLVPFDYRPVLESVARTGRFLAVTEAAERGSFAQTVAATVARHGFSDLRAPPRVIGAPNWIVPGADMEATFFPQAHDIVDAVMADFFADRRANRRGVRDWNDLDLARSGL
ncbi:MAG: alpha-ketoacid dehydrogenase subunit beta, partial [Gemmobacter sp.]